MAEKCAGRKPSLSGYDSYPCHNPGKLQEEGLWWCGIHAPSAVRARREKWQAKWDVGAEQYRQQHAAEAERDRRAALFPELVAGIADILEIAEHRGDNAIVRVSLKARTLLKQAEPHD